MNLLNLVILSWGDANLDIDINLSLLISILLKLLILYNHSSFELFKIISGLYFKSDGINDEKVGFPSAEYS